MPNLKKKIVVLMLPVLIVIIVFGAGTGAGLLLSNDGVDSTTLHAGIYPSRSGSIDLATILLFVGGASGAAFLACQKRKA